MQRKYMYLLQIKEAKGDSLTSPELVAKLMSEEGKLDREAFWVLHLNTKNRLIEMELVSLGILDTLIIHPREVFKRAILNSSHSIITFTTIPVVIHHRHRKTREYGKG